MSKLIPILNNDEEQREIQFEHKIPPEMIKVRKKSEHVTIWKNVTINMKLRMRETLNTHYNIPTWNLEATLMMVVIVRKEGLIFP